MAKWLDTLSPFERRPGTTVDVSAKTTTDDWPAQYVELLSFMDGGEGFVSNEYVRIFQHADAVWLNTETPLSEFRDGLFIFGSNGGGEAFAFDERGQNRIVEVQFIPLTRKYAKPIADDLSMWLSSKSASAPTNRALIGKEIYEIKPVIFGGDPIDPKNKTLLEFRKYVEAVVWWNNMYRQMSGAAG